MSPTCYQGDRGWSGVPFLGGLASYDLVFHRPTTQGLFRNLEWGWPDTFFGSGSKKHPRSQQPSQGKDVPHSPNSRYRSWRLEEKCLPQEGDVRLPELLDSLQGSVMGQPDGVRQHHPKPLKGRGDVCANCECVFV